MTSDTLNQRFVYVPRSALVASLILHLAFPVFLGLTALLDFVGLRILPERKKNPPMEIYQNFIQVDMVALPDQTMEQMKNMDATLPVVDEQKAVDKGETKEPEKTPEMILEEQKAADEAKRAVEEKAQLEKAARDKAKQEEEKRKAEETKAKKDQEKARKKAEDELKRAKALKELQGKGDKVGRQKLKGNLLSKGTATRGNIGKDMDAYGARILQRIKDQFNIYPWQKKRNLLSTVYLELLPTGRIKEKRLMKSSGDSVFDALVLQAVEAAQPYPVPDDFTLIADGIKIDFTPETK